MSSDAKHDCVRIVQEDEKPITDLHRGDFLSGKGIGGVADEQTGLTHCSGMKKRLD